MQTIRLSLSPTQAIRYLLNLATIEDSSTGSGNVSPQCASAITALANTAINPTAPTSITLCLDTQVVGEYGDLASIVAVRLVMSSRTSGEKVLSITSPSKSALPDILLGTS